MTPRRALARWVSGWVSREEARWSKRSGPVLLAATGTAAVLIGLLVATPRTFRPTFTYVAGDFAAATVRAPWDLSIPDEAGTARLRDEAARYTAPVASFDPSPATAVPLRLAELFKQARERIADADRRREVPPAELAGLSSRRQATPAPGKGRRGRPGRSGGRAGHACRIRAAARRRALARRPDAARGRPVRGTARRRAGGPAQGSPFETHRARRAATAGGGRTKPAARGAPARRAAQRFILA